MTGITVSQQSGRQIENADEKGNEHVVLVVLAQNLIHLRAEAKEKLDRIRPLNLGQAERITGITPADIAVLVIALDKKTG